MTTPAPTQSAHNVTAGPAASAGLASLTGLTAGRYQIIVYAYLAGTVTPADADNVELLVDGTATDVLAVPPVAVASGSVESQVFEHITADGAIKLQAVGAGGASAVYHTLLVVAPLGDYVPT